MSFTYFYSKHKRELLQFIAAGAVLSYLFTISSCANQGVGPSGGLRDSIPPVVISSTPHNYQTNFPGNEIVLGFDEFIVAENLANIMVVSPPIAEKPNIRIRGKNLIVKLEEDLIPGRTYSVDFKDGIKDFNEGNQIESLRMIFSTYDQIDTLRISGYLLDAFTLEPVKDAMATLYSLEHDSVFTSLKPDFIAKANDEGFFMFDNLPEGKFRLFGLVDSDRKLFFSSDNEAIAFTDTLIAPSAVFIAEPDTIINNNDTIVSPGYTQYNPEPVFPLLFTHKYYNQSLTYSRRESADFMLFTFREELTDSFAVHIAGHDLEEWAYVEYGNNRDSVSIWITDTLVSVTDTLQLFLKYTVTDSLENFVSKTDTLNMSYNPGRKSSRAKSADENEEREEKPKIFEFESNLSSGTFDLNKKVEIISPMPVIDLNNDAFSLEIQVNDSTYDSVPFRIINKNDSKRKFIVDFEIQETATYKFTIDSAAIFTFSGYHNNGFEKIFKTQALEHYGTIIFDIQGIDTTAIVQLLKDSKTEDVVKEIHLNGKENAAIFDFLKPGKFRAKLIIDKNANGKWDTGNFNKNIQPEPVFYFSKILEVKSNWELKEMWKLENGKSQIKNFINNDESNQ
jgi:hypothetical protein